jgi:hypothetical protein
MHNKRKAKKKNGFTCPPPHHPSPAKLNKAEHKLSCAGYFSLKRGYRNLYLIAISFIHFVGKPCEQKWTSLYFIYFPMTMRTINMKQFLIAAPPKITDQHNFLVYLSISPVLFRLLLDIFFWTSGYEFR